MILLCQKSWKVTLKGPGIELDATVLPTKKVPTNAVTETLTRAGISSKLPQREVPAWGPKQDFP